MDQDLSTQVILNDEEFLDQFAMRYRTYSHDAKRCLQESLEKYHNGVLEHGPTRYADRDPIEWIRMMKQELQDLQFYGPMVKQSIEDIHVAILKVEKIAYQGPDDPRLAITEKSKGV